MIYKPFKDHLESLAGFKKLLAAFCLGTLMTLAMSPFGLFPVLLIAIPGLAVLARNSRTRASSFWTGWAFGSGYFIFGLYWISAALFVDIDQWKWVLPLSLVVGPSVLALLYGFITLLAHRYRGNAPAHALALTASFAGIEWLRGHILTGFPWNLPGMSWDWVLPVMQFAAFAGVYGLSLLTIFWGLLPVFMKHHKRLAHLAILSFAFIFLCGAIRLAVHPTVPHGDITVRIVQGNIPEETKWNKDDDYRHFQHHLDLSATKSAVAPRFVIWPETAVQADLAQFPEIAKLIWLKMPKGSWPILGSLRVDDTIASAPKFFNSVTLMNPAGSVENEYNKHHLVPFGEYIPFRKNLGLTPIAMAVANVGDFTRGDGPATVAPGDLPRFSPLVCYEVIFPHEVVNEADRPEWMVNVTNDGWYGNSTGPYQHFASARMRAVEEGLPLARAANTGISGMIDPAGRVLARQPLLTSGALDVPLPEKIDQTPYARYGDVFFWMLLVIFGMGAEIILKPKAFPKA